MMFATPKHSNVFYDVAPMMCKYVQIIAHCCYSICRYWHRWWWWCWWWRWWCKPQNETIHESGFPAPQLHGNMDVPSPTQYLEGVFTPSSQNRISPWGVCRPSQSQSLQSMVSNRSLHPTQPIQFWLLQSICLGWDFGDSNTWRNQPLCVSEANQSWFWDL